MHYDNKQSIKEVLRHVLMKTGSHGLLELSRRRKGYVTSHLDENSIEGRFDTIYDKDVWLQGREARSGTGSEKDVALPMAGQLVILLQDLKCDLLLDVGCGDWNWMSEVQLPCRYIGVDIVSKVVKANQRFANDQVSFETLNAVDEELPKADAILCREMLFHLSFADAKKALVNMCKSAEWLLLTTDPAIWFNSDIKTGDFRRINLEYAPYRFPVPYSSIADDGMVAERVLGIWKSADIMSETRDK